MARAKMHKADVIEAEIIAAHLLGCRMREQDVRKALRDGDFHLSVQQAIRIVRNVQEQWRDEAVAIKSDIRAQTYRALDEATQLAFKQKDIRAVIASERLRGEIAGLIGSGVDIHVGGPVQAANDRPWTNEAEADCWGIFGKLPKDLTPSEQDQYTELKAVRAN